MYEQQIFHFGDVVHGDWKKNTVDLPEPEPDENTHNQSTSSSDDGRQQEYGGGQFVGTFDRNGLPIGGGSFVSWRCHGIEMTGRVKGGFSLTPSTQLTNVIDIVEIPFTPTTSIIESKQQNHQGQVIVDTEMIGNIDIGTPNNKNLGAIRLKLPASAGHVTGNSAIHMKHETGVTNSGDEDDESIPGKMTLCVATSNGYLYRIEFPHHPCDVHSVSSMGTLRSSLSRSTPDMKLQTINIHGNESKWMDTTEYSDTTTLMITKVRNGGQGEHGPASIISINSDWSAVELRPLTPVRTSGGISQVISWISGNQSQMSKAAPSNITLSTTPLDAWKSGKNGQDHIHHITGTIIETGIGLIAVVVKSDTQDVNKSGIEIWTAVEKEESGNPSTYDNNNNLDSDDWVRTCILEEKDIGPSFHSAIQKNPKSMNLQAVAFGEQRSMIAVVLSFNEYIESGDDDELICSTRILRFDGKLRDPSNTSDDEEAPFGVFLPVLPENESESVSTIPGVHLDDQRPYVIDRDDPQCDLSKQVMCDTRVISIHLNVMDIDESNENSDAKPTLNILLETKERSSNISKTLLLHMDKFTDVYPRVENTLNTTQLRSIARSNISKNDFLPFDNDEGEDEYDTQPMSVNDIEEYFMKRVTIPGRYSKSSINSAISIMLGPYVNHNGSDSLRYMKDMISNAVQKEFSSISSSHGGSSSISSSSSSRSSKEENKYYNARVRAWKTFLNHCEKAESRGRTSIGFIESTCHKYDQTDDKCYITGKYVLGVVRKSNLSLLRAPTPVETLESRMQEFTKVKMTPFSLSAADEILVTSGLLMEDAKLTPEGRDLVNQLLNMNPLNALNNNEHFVNKASGLLNELCDLLDRAYTCDDQRSSLAFECHAMLSTHIRRFGISGFKNIITNVLAYHVPMKNDGQQVQPVITRVRSELDTSPRITSAAAAYSANTLRDVATSSCHLSISIALCMTMTLRRFLHGTGPRTKISSSSSSSSSSSVDVVLRHQLFSLMRVELLGSILLRSMIIRDLGNCNMVGKHPHDDHISDGRMITMRIKRLIFDEDGTHLNANTSHGGEEFLKLMELTASANTTVDGGEEENEIDGPIDQHMYLWGTSMKSNVEGKSVLDVLLLYYTDVVPMESNQETMLSSGAGRVLDPRQWFYDVSTLWNDRTAINQEIPLSMSHVTGFLISRGQVETLAKLSAAMLSGVNLNEFGSNNSDDNKRSNLANLRLLGECWLTTSDRSDSDENMDRAFRYLLRSCPTKQGEISSTTAEFNINFDDEDDEGDDDDIFDEDDDINNITKKARRDRIRYLMAMMNAFASSRRPKHAVLCSRAAITSIGTPRSKSEKKLLSTLWRSIFTQCVTMCDFDDAWLAIGSNPDSEARSFCVQQLVCAMYDAQSLDILLRLPLAYGSKSNFVELERALTRKANFTPLDFENNSTDNENSETLSVAVHHYLYAIHIKHNNYRRAAEIMYSLAKAAIAQGMPTERSLSTKQSAINICTDALATATAALRLLPKADERYILDLVSSIEMTNGENKSDMEMDDDDYDDDDDDDDDDDEGDKALKPVWIEDLQCLIAHNRCRFAIMERYIKNKKIEKVKKVEKSSHSRKRARSINNEEDEEDVDTDIPNLLAPAKEMTLMMILSPDTTVIEYEMAVETAVLHTMDQHRPENEITPTNYSRLQWLKPIVSKLSKHIVLLRLANDATYETDGTKATVIRLENLLKSILYRLDGIESNFALHISSADAMLSVDDAIGLPTWLVDSLKGGAGALRYGRALPINKSSTECKMPSTKYLPTFANGGGHPTSLITIYMKHGRLADACDIASTTISNVNASISLERQIPTHKGDIWTSGSMVPHGVLDELMARCEATIKQNSIVLYGEGILQKVNDNNDDIPDERVVHKLKSSLSYLKKSIVNYFDGILEQNEIFKDGIEALKNDPDWKNSLEAVNEN